jgi:hypothetical protein
MNKHRTVKHLPLVLAMAVAMTVTKTEARRSVAAQEQANAQSEAPGKVVGKIKPKVLTGFDVWLSVPNTPEQIAKQFSSDGNFALEGIHPGTYELNVQVHNFFGGCPFFPYSKQITVHAGEVIHVTANVKRNPKAICE